MNNVLTRTDNITSQNESFTYDNYDRLDTWTNNGNVLNYNYDIFGNIKNNSYNNIMTYNNKNQITSKTNTNNKKYNFAYDNNGNIVDDGKKEYTYTPFNKVKTIKVKKDNRTIYFNYDSFNNLVSKKENTTTIYYINKEYEYTNIYNLSTRKTTLVMKHNLFNGNTLSHLQLVVP